MAKKIKVRVIRRIDDKYSVTGHVFIYEGLYLVVERS
jgi:hypothetical protein